MHRTEVARRPLGTCGLDVPSVALGTGPVGALWTSADENFHDQALRRALESGINWFDTAAGYGQGMSEQNLGRALRRSRAVERVDVATKVRLEASDLDDLGGAIQRSFHASLERLGLPRVTLLQLHNSVTERRGDEPTSLAIDDVLGPGGVADQLEALRAAGLCRLVGFTGLGSASALRQLVASGRFQTMQIPFSLANPTAGWPAPHQFGEADYGQVLDECLARGIGVFAIRVFAGGALAGRAPSDYTRVTRFFKLDLYERDQVRAARFQRVLPESLSLQEAALRFAFNHPAISSVIVGAASTDEIDDAVRFADAGPLPRELTAQLLDQL